MATTFDAFDVATFQVPKPRSGATASDSDLLGDWRGDWTRAAWLVKARLKAMAALMNNMLPYSFRLPVNAIGRRSEIDRRLEV